MDGAEPFAAERVEVAGAARAYGEAVFRGDVATLRALFAEDAPLHGVEGGRVATLTREAWLARVAARPAPPAEAPSGTQVEWVDLSGPETAVARVIVSAGGRRFRDYLTFLKAEGSWRVVAKAWRPADLPTDAA